MSKLFEPTSLIGMNLSNRFVRSATWEGLATTDGAVTPKLIDRMVELAKGGVGLIITSHTYISKEGQGTPWQLGIYKDELIQGLKKLTTAVHENGGKIILQLAHAGNYAEESLTQQPPLVVSNFEGLAETERKEITQDEIEKLIKSYATAAERAKRAGFDGVQIHSAHGYLLSQFLSPVFNKRQDEYGGSIDNRSRIHLEIYQSVRKVVGENFPILIKMNCGDFVENGLNIKESIQVAKLVATARFNAIELSGGFIKTGKLSPSPSRPGINSQDKEAYFQKYAHKIKNEIAIPLILVGGMRSFKIAERIILEGTADYISMSRPFIREPDLINRWQSGDRRKAKCISDNLCFNPGFEGKGVYCVTKEREAERKTAL
ncbi:MAG: NADH:flavin oxidoreductase [Deltaproteobacteria bacterium]|nr:NADH:flavin oxidoreductase [Deltaproteobacteria bacterium]